MKKLAAFATGVIALLPATIAFADASVSIAGLSPGSTVAVGVTVFFNAAPVEFTNPTYEISDSNTSSSLSPGAINQFGGFVWTPKVQDVGSHTFTLTARDSLGNSASVTQAITVNAPPSVSITSLSASSTTPGTPITFTTAVSGYTSPTYAVADSVPSSLLSTAISSAGSFSWTPNRYDVGLHTISVSVSDSTGLHSVLPITIEVKNASMKIGPLSPGTTVAVGKTLDFSVDVVGLSEPRYRLGDSFAATTMTDANVTASGTVTWIPTARDIGSHNITVRAEDNTAAAASASVLVSVVGATTSVPLAAPTPSAVASSTKPVAKSSFLFTKKLAQGSRGVDVTELQKLLIANGYLKGEATGYFGGMTAAAVKKLQIVLKLEPVGSVGPATRAKLNAGIPAYI